MDAPGAAAAHAKGEQLTTLSITALPQWRDAVSVSNAGKKAAWAWSPTHRDTLLPGRFILVPEYIHMRNLCRVGILTGVNSYKLFGNVTIIFHSKRM